MDTKEELLLAFNKYFASFDEKFYNSNYVWTKEDDENLDELVELTNQAAYFHRGWLARIRWEELETWTCDCGADNFNRLTCQICNHKRP